MKIEIRSTRPARIAPTEWAQRPRPVDPTIPTMRQIRYASKIIAAAYLQYQDDKVTLAWEDDRVMHVEY